MSEDTSGTDLFQKMSTLLFEELEQVQAIYEVCSLVEVGEGFVLCEMGGIVGPPR